MGVVGNDVFHRAEQPCYRQCVGCLSLLLLSLVLANICEICDSTHELRPPNCSVALLASHVLVVPREVVVKVLLQSHIADEPEAADATLKLHALIDLGYCKDVEPYTVNNKLLTL